MILREATPAKVACIPPFVLRRIATKFITKFYDNTGAHLNTEYGDLVNPPSHDHSFYIITFNSGVRSKLKVRGGGSRPNIRNLNKPKKNPEKKGDSDYSQTHPQKS